MVKTMCHISFYHWSMKCCPLLPLVDDVSYKFLPLVDEMLYIITVYPCTRLTLVCFMDFLLSEDLSFISMFALMMVCSISDLNTTVFNIRYMITLIVSLYRNWYLHSTINKVYLLEYTGNQ
jgi:hypothetical protein